MQVDKRMQVDQRELVHKRMQANIQAALDRGYTLEDTEMTVRYLWCFKKTLYESEYESSMYWQTVHKYLSFGQKLIKCSHRYRG